ncbi:MAG: hypothetical protein EHM23_33990 [Acidobacteria bacterium]|nr:MAG: hypothetical protein EHM23_33990 [Acidobacteriota bacterium]
MINRDAARTNSLSFLALLTAVLILSVGVPDPLLAASQSRAQGVRMLNWHSYFPLDTGSRWVYTVHRQGFADATREVNVTGEESAAAFRSYFELSGYFGGKNPKLVRTTVFGSVVERGDDGKDYLWYDFTRRVGKSWVMELAGEDGCEDGATLTIGARDEVLTVPAGEFKQVIRIDFITKCADAGITQEWFAPGVGLIRREESSISGPIVSELVYAELGDKIFPAAVYSTTLHLSSSRYWNAQMSIPSPALMTLPRVSGAFIVRDTTREPGELGFPSACRDLQLEVRNQAGDVVLLVDTREGHGCADVVTRHDLGKEALVVPFSFTLADKDGKPLPDGDYSITAVLLNTPAASEALRPAARALIQVTSVQ